MSNSPEHNEFDDYFNLADEIWGGLTLDDLDGKCVDRAKSASATLGLPWPPYLPAAEEMLLDRIEAQRRRERYE